MTEPTATVLAAAGQDGAALRRLWLGTYPPGGPGSAPDTGEGLWRLDLDPVTGALSGALAVRCAAPSFLVLSPDRRTLYAVGETSAGTLSCFAVGDDGALTRRSVVAVGGSDPCHVLLDGAGLTAYVSCYTSGTVAVVPLGPDGDLAPEVRAAGGPVQVLGGSGSGPVTDRQDGPHTHSCVLTPGGSHLLVADLGTDEVRCYRVLAGGRLEPDGVAVAMPAGTGPRHMAFGAGDHLYVVGELAATVHVLAWDGATGRAHLVQTLPACASPRVSGDAVYPAHVVVLPGEVLVSVRGADVLARFTVHDDGARLVHAADVPVGGSWPRHFTVVETVSGAGWVVVAAQKSGVLTVLPRSGADGPAVPDATRPMGVATPALAVGHPACVVAG